MKIAIIGQGNLAKNMIKWLSEQEVETVLFTSDLPPFEDNWNFPYLKIVHESITRIQKEYEFHGEDIVPMRDLFWVVTKTHISKPDEAWGNLPLDVQKDMLRPMEKYESVDAIIEFKNETSLFVHPYLGGNTLAIDEAWVRQVHPHLFFDGAEIETFFESMDEINQKSPVKLFLVGSHPKINDYLPRLWEQVQNQKLQIMWSLGNDGQTIADVSKKIPFLADVLSQKKILEDTATKKYFADFDVWNQLESYEKAKIAAPQKPSIAFSLLENYKIKSLSKLSNHRELMIHLECPPWIKLESTSMVLSMDACWNMQSLKNSFHQLYMPNQSYGVLSYSEKSVDDELMIREDIKKHIFSFFSKVD